MLERLPDAIGAISSVHRGEDALALLHDRRWDDLVLQQARPNPTLLGAWQRVLGGLGLGEPLVVTVSSGGTLLAAGAFTVRRALRGRLSAAAWLGKSLQSFSPDILASAPEYAEVLVDRLLGEVDLVKLTTVEGGRFAAAVRRLAPWASVHAAPGTFVTELPVTTHARLQRSAASDQRRAERAGVRVEVQVATDPADVAPALERLFRLHRSRWWGRAWENANFSTGARTRAFHRAAVIALAREDGVRLAEIFEDGQLVASNLALLAGRGGVGYRMATQPGSGLKGPGHFALLAVLEQLEADGCRVFDLGGGALDPASPKGRLKPIEQGFAELVVASSPRVQSLVRLAAAGRARTTGYRIGPAPGATPQTR